MIQENSEKNQKLKEEIYQKSERWREKILHLYIYVLELYKESNFRNVHKNLLKKLNITCSKEINEMLITKEVKLKYIETNYLVKKEKKLIKCVDDKV